MVFLDRLLAHERYVLITHVRPDGDAVGAQLALARFLEAHGKTVVCLNSDPAPDNLAWLPGLDALQVFDGSLHQREAVASAGAFVVVDTNARDRLGKVATLLDTTAAETFLIDHHTNPEDWFAHRHVREEASSTGELVYELFEAAGTPFDGPTAELLYTAIMTDTGSFRFSSVTPRVHRIVADLLERGGISPAPIHVAVYDNRPLGALRLLSRALGTIQVACGGHLATMTLSREMIKRADVHTEETDGFVNYALSVEGVRAAVLFLETAHGVKLSFRSKGDTFVHEWARHFGGGGHRNASGAYVRGRSLEQVHTDVVATAPRFLTPDAPADAPAAPEVHDADAALLAQMQQAAQRKAEHFDRGKDRLRAHFQPK